VPSRAEGWTSERRANLSAAMVGNQNGLRHSHARCGAMTPTYNTWRAIHDRCLNPNVVNYPRYGGKGIQLCERWLIFENFLTDMGERPEGTTIDRIDPYGNYEPGNCRWATPKEQGANWR